MKEFILGGELSVDEGADAIPSLTVVEDDIEVGVGGFDWLVAEAEFAFPALQDVCRGNELDMGKLLPPLGDIWG